MITAGMVLCLGMLASGCPLNAADTLNYTRNGDIQAAQGDSIPPGYSGNPIIRNIFTADPCAMVYDDTLYLFTGHDEQNTVNDWFFMRDWHIFSTTDMVKYTDHGARLACTDFSWASGNAFAGHCIYNHGKFWWYVPMTHKTIKVNEGFAIGVAVADRPTGPYTDAVGQALITDDTPNSAALNIDPAVFIDDDGQVYLFWGSWGACRMVKLRDNMTELDGAVETVNAPNFFEAPWVHKRNGIYYLTYASGYPSIIAYSTSSSIRGPWTYRGILNDRVYNSETNHPAIVKYRWNWYFFYHNGALPTGGTYRRSVCVERLYYNEDGTMKKIVQTGEGVEELPAGMEMYKSGTSGSLKIYPNPLAGNTLTIELRGNRYGRECEISIHSIGGKVIFKDLLYPDNPDGRSVLRLDRALLPGAYIVVARTGDTIYNALLMVDDRHKN